MPDRERNMRAAETSHGHVGPLRQGVPAGEHFRTFVSWVTSRRLSQVELAAGKVPTPSRKTDASRRRDELVDATRELRPAGFLKKMSPFDARVGLALGPRHSLLKERVEVA